MKRDGQLTRALRSSTSRNPIADRWGARTAPSGEMLRSTLPSDIPLSVALGELTEWFQPNQPVVPSGAWAGISFRKLGLAGAGSHWRRDWRELRSRTEVEESPPWIAVVYADWQSVAAPDPDAVLEVAGESPEVVGVLIDTYSKAGPFRIDARWLAWAENVRQAGLMLAVAGGLDRQSIPALSGIVPDIVAVRGAACSGGQRRAAIDPDRVQELAQAVAALPENSQSVTAFSRAPHKANRTFCQDGRGYGRQCRYAKACDQLFERPYPLE